MAAKRSDSHGQRANRKDNGYADSKREPSFRCHGGTSITPSPDYLLAIGEGAIFIH